jgi:hypothetical protein
MICYQTEYTPEEVGYEPARIEAVNNHLKDLIEKKKIISVAIWQLIKDGKIRAVRQRLCLAEGI